MTANLKTGWQLPKLRVQEQTESTLAAFIEGQGAQKATGKGADRMPQHIPQVSESLGITLSPNLC